MSPLSTFSIPPDGVSLPVLRVLGLDAACEAALLASLQTHVDAGRVWLDTDHDSRPQRFGLTDPEGMLLSNTILSDIFEALDCKVSTAS